MPNRGPILKNLFVLAAAGAALMGLHDAGHAETVKVGLIAPMSGPVASLGQSMDRGAKLYEKLHAGSLPDAVKLEIIRRDDAGSPDNTRRIAQELITRNGVKMLTGVALSPQAFTIAPLLTEAKVPLAMMLATTSNLTRASEYFVRFSYTQWQLAFSIGSWAAKNGLKKTYTLVADYSAGADSEAAFKKGFEDGGGKVVGSVRVPMATNDYLPFMERIKSESPDSVFFFVNSGRVPAVVRAFVDSGMRASGVKLIGPGDQILDDELPTMPAEIAGMITAGIYVSGNDLESTRAFVKAYKEEYGADTFPNTGVAIGWDAMSAIYSAVKATGGKMQVDAVMDHLSKWKTTESPRGEISIDPKTRDIVQTIYINKVEIVDGKPKNVIIDRIKDVKDPWKTLNPE